VQIGRMADGRDVARAVPRRPDPEELRERRELPRGSDAADVRDVHPDEVDQAVPDERHGLALADEQLPHRDRRAGLRSKEAQVLLVLRRNRVLQEEQPVGLEVLGELDGHDRGHPLVNVVEQLDVLAEARPELFEHPGHLATVRPGLPGILARVQPPERCVPASGRRRACAAVPVGGVARHVHLAADVAEAGLPEGTDPILELVDVSPVGVDVDVGRAADTAAEQLVDGHPGPLALDVPQGLVDAGHGVVEDRPAAPVGADIRRLPDVLDVVRVAADEERPQVVLDRGHDRERALRERRAPDAPETRVARLDLHDHEPDAVRGRADRPDVGDRHRRQARAGLPGRGGSGVRARLADVRHRAYRRIRAPAPLTSASTSACVAIDVSPGVVIASAPWAAPYSTAAPGSPFSMRP
jgi:hypothetical protein